MNEVRHSANSENNLNLHSGYSYGPPAVEYGPPPVTYSSNFVPYPSYGHSSYGPVRWQNMQYVHALLSNSAKYATQCRSELCYRCIFVASFKHCI